MEEIEIKSLFKKDKKKFIFFFKLYLNEINFKKFNKEKIALMTKRIINDKNKKKIIFYNQKNMLGFIVVNFYKNLLNLNVCKINDFYIREEFRRKGFGLKLIKKFNTKIHYKKIKEFKIEILDKNYSAKKFWKAFGIKMISSSYSIDL